jgi:predicted transcriptional regulator
MVKVTRSIAIDPDILKAVEKYASVLKESTNTVIQRAVRELLEREGYWPLKGKA